MDEEELVYRFVGYDELSRTLERISDNLDRVADNTETSARRLEELGLAFNMLRLESLGIRGELEKINDQLGQMTLRATAAGAAATGAAGGIGLMGAVTFITANPIVSLVAAIIILTLAISTLLPVVGVFVASLIPLIVGLAAMYIVMGVALLAIGGMGAGILMLTGRLGLINGPLNKLTTDLKNMAETLGKQAVPMAKELIKFLDSLIPSVKSMGQELLNWFGPRLHMILAVTRILFDDVIEVLHEIGPAIGKVVDYFLHSPAMISLFGQTLQFIADAIIGLLDNFTRLADWFSTRLPALEGIAGAGFNQIGKFVQWLGVQFGKFVDFLISSWPKAVSITVGALRWLNEAWNAIVAGFRIASPIFGIIVFLWDRLTTAIRLLDPHLEITRQIFIGLGVVVAVIVFLLAMTVLSFVELIVIILAVVKGINMLVGWIRGSAIPAIQEWWNAIVAFIGGTFSAIGTFFNNIITTAENGWNTFTQRPAYWIGFLIGWILGKLFLLHNAFMNWIGSLIGVAGSGFNNLVNAAIGALMRLPGQVWNILVWAVNTLASVLSWGAGVAAANAWNVVGAIAGAIASLPGRMYGIGRDIIFGIGNGLWSLYGWIRRQAEQIAWGILDGIKSALGIGSPSLLAALEVGMPIMQGISLGVQRELPRTQHVINSLVGNMPRQVPAPVNANSNVLLRNQLNQQQVVQLKIDNDELAKVTIRSVAKWRDLIEHV